MLVAEPIHCVYLLKKVFEVSFYKGSKSRRSGLAPPPPPPPKPVDNGKEAGGTGKAFANTCWSCAEGHFVKYPVKFRLTKPRKNSCGGQSVRYFHKIKITWKGY